MSDRQAIKTSLEVGFPEGTLPEGYRALRGKQTRAIPETTDFPFEDAQFDVVMVSGAALSPALVREAHRVLCPSGRLYFTVPEKTSSQDGMTLPQLYSLLRDGFNLTKVDRSSWWRFWSRERNLAVCATKKVWRHYKGFCRGNVVLSPFHTQA